jgi:hypothetical protein
MALVMQRALETSLAKGSREFWADQRLDGRVVTEGLRELGEARD